MKPLKGVPIEERFNTGYSICSHCNCWNWNRAKDKNGYGYIKYLGKTTKVHRVAYLLYRGEIGAFCVLHTCDNPSCVNPAHLWLGTNTDNMMDKTRKGRASRTGGNKHQFGKDNPNYRHGKLCKMDTRIQPEICRFIDI